MIVEDVIHRTANIAETDYTRWRARKRATCMGTIARPWLGNEDHFGITMILMEWIWLFQYPSSRNVFRFRRLKTEPGGERRVNP